MKALEKQVGSDHYKNSKVQPVEYIMAQQMGFCEGNVIKYVSRWRLKGGVQDLEKAKHYIEILQEARAYQTLFIRIRAAIRYGAWWGRTIPTDLFLRENQIATPEAGIIRHIEYWNCSGNKRELNSAMKWIEELMEAQECQAS